jgi:hypothetical protein
MSVIFLIVIFLRVTLISTWCCSAEIIRLSVSLMFVIILLSVILLNILLLSVMLLNAILLVTTELHTLKNGSNCLNTNIYSYLETSGGQSSILYLNIVNFFNTSVNKLLSLTLGSFF